MTTARTTNAPVDPSFPARWSPRAFKEDPVSVEQLHTVLEAARFAPSGMNEQPWLILYAQSVADRRVFTSLLVESNQVWAARAPVLMFFFARKHYERSGKPNRTAVFDTGAAWMSLTLQANKLGLVTHGMGGIHLDKVCSTLGVPDDKYEPICAAAMGYQADAAILPEPVRAREFPSARKHFNEWAFEGRFPG